MSASQPAPLPKEDAEKRMSALADHLVKVITPEIRASAAGTTTAVSAGLVEVTTKLDELLAKASDSLEMLRAMMAGGENGFAAPPPLPAGGAGAAAAGATRARAGKAGGKAGKAAKPAADDAKKQVSSGPLLLKRVLLAGQDPILLGGECLGVQWAPLVNEDALAEAKASLDAKAVEAGPASELYKAGLAKRIWDMKKEDQSWKDLVTSSRNTYNRILAGEPPAAAQCEADLASSVPVPGAAEAAGSAVYNDFTDVYASGAAEADPAPFEDDI